MGHDGHRFTNGSGQQEVLCSSLANFFMFTIISKLQNYLDKKMKVKIKILLDKNWESSLSADERKF